MRLENLDSIVGETLSSIDIDPKMEHIRLETKSGRVINIFHDQCYCETVRIKNIDGNFIDLVGRVVTESGVDVEPGGKPEPHLESWTWTTITLKADESTVICRWLGTSNGYYSEDVHFEEVTSCLDRP